MINLKHLAKHNKEYH